MKGSELSNFLLTFCESPAAFLGICEGCTCCCATVCVYNIFTGNYSPLHFMSACVSVSDVLGVGQRFELREESGAIGSLCRRTFLLRGQVVHGPAELQESLLKSAFSFYHSVQHKEWDDGEGDGGNEPAQDVRPQRINVSVAELQRGVFDNREDERAKADEGSNVSPAVLHQRVRAITNHVRDVAIETLSTINPGDADGLTEGQEEQGGAAADVMVH